MALFGKKADPISARSKELAAQISALEAQIRQLSGKIEHSRAHPRVQSTALPHGRTILANSSATHAGSAAGGRPAASSTLPRDPIFEPLERRAARSTADLDTSSAHYNDLGVRKFDLLGVIRRFQNNFRPAPAANPRLVSYLAAGSIRGLRPLRYEKRIARNRFIFLSAVFVLILWGIVAAFLTQT